eukprot:CAMPEP_0119383150 /NCGR_PEP_ID=MMETSP1334-20130426/77412_1 /TAXON_ID=127549 /ORGANISM="Calcidiscus leptoporus, Strain RCC1130" /LENGTH=65 /DNA_ID=CAMNT_0007403867 /DNA_START=152 /DNA_END=349 /DNA_ORIENTATION=+
MARKRPNASGEQHASHNLRTTLCGLAALLSRAADFKAMAASHDKVSGGRAARITAQRGEPSSRRK